jgi:hypothetical protein
LADLATDVAGFAGTFFATGLAAALLAGLDAGLATGLDTGLGADLTAAFGAGLAAGLPGLATGFGTGLLVIFLAGAALALTIGFFTVVDFLTVDFTVLPPRRLSLAFRAASPAAGLSDFFNRWELDLRIAVGADCSDLTQENPINSKIYTNTTKSLKVLHQTLLQTLH